MTKIITMSLRERERGRKKKVPTLWGREMTEFLQMAHCCSRSVEVSAALFDKDLGKYSERSISSDIFSVFAFWHENEICMCVFPALQFY